jgi:hypothetical protein
VANTLQSYLVDTRFILHDPNSKTFLDAQLTSAVNKARDRVITDTLSTQSVVSLPLVSGQETYSFNTILSALQPIAPSARALQAILSVNFVQAPTLKQPLEPIPWSALNQRYRLQPINSLPESYAILPDLGGPLASLYLGPAPSGSIWSMEVRCSWLALPLVNFTDIEQAIPSPLAETLVPFMAASWAWSFNDDEESADKLEAKYLRYLTQYAAAMPPYSSPPFASVYD